MAKFVFVPGENFKSPPSVGLHWHLYTGGTLVLGTHTGSFVQKLFGSISLCLSPPDLQ